MYRFSKKRQAIYDCLQGTTTHPTANWIHQQLRSDYPDLSLGTVYRNLLHMKEMGLIQSVGVVAGHQRFDAVTTPHPHLICQSCGAVEDLPGISLPSDLASVVQQTTGYQIADASLCLYGRCPACQKASVS